MTGIECCLCVPALREFLSQTLTTSGSVQGPCVKSRMLSKIPIKNGEEKAGQNVC